MSTTKIINRARAYSQYGGAPRQAACAFVAAPPGAPLVPAPAEPAQLLFESEIFYQILSSQRPFSDYPFGICYVQPTAAALRLHLESNASLDTLLGGLLTRRVPMGTGPDGQA
ncbi:hypothetical protein ACFWGI_06790 [Streptomyces niveus]|uniref:hypothetical protein n=1 Tax=Streptomyces niveus TaxID=193462 RepID=UPI00365854B5